MMATHELVVPKLQCQMILPIILFPENFWKRCCFRLFLK